MFEEADRDNSNSLWVIKTMDRCQACLSVSTNIKDYLLTCKLCQSCIHSKEYGQEKLLEEGWMCQRCSYLLQHGPNTEVKCAFCPSIEGIMRQYRLENKATWLHPECVMWADPLIFFTNSKRNAIQKVQPENEAALFWCPELGTLDIPCSVCQGKEGFLIKCKYYSCMQRYHVTCAKSIGVVRDLQTMKSSKDADTYFPVYCRKHIQLRVSDYRKRSKQLIKKGQEEKAAHFNKISFLFEVQLNHLNEAEENYKKEEKARKEMNQKIERARRSNEGRILSLSGMQESYESFPLEFIQKVEEDIMKQGIELKSLSELRKSIQERQMVQQESEMIQEVGRPQSANVASVQEQAIKSQDPEQINEERDDSSPSNQHSEFSY